jgi:hypothetical protein
VVRPYFYLTIIKKILLSRDLQKELVGGHRTIAIEEFAAAFLQKHILVVTMLKIT